MRDSLLSQLARYWRHLPPALRLLSLLALLSALASIGVAAWTFLPLAGQQQALANWGLGLAPPLGSLRLACMWPVTVYTHRLRSAAHEGRPSVLSRRTLVTVTLALVALPVCALALALLISPAASQFGVVFLLEMLSGWLLLAAYIWAIVRAATPLG